MLLQGLRRVLLCLLALVVLSLLAVQRRMRSLAVQPLHLHRFALATHVGANMVAGNTENSPLLLQLHCNKMLAADKV